MNMLFISHSSLNNLEAQGLCDRLREQGWDEIFLDLDPERGIAAGERWEKALHRAASRCDAVLFLVSRHWLDSEWCRREFHLAQKLNKRCFILLIEDIPVGELPKELTECWQVVNLAAGTDHGRAREVHLPGSTGPGFVYFSQSALKRLETGLKKAGLEPRFFAWPPDSDPRRSPYRGLRPLDMEDAGIFFGREAPLIDLMARLRGLHGSAPPRFLAILGASGAGKSSFLRAGILPRLQRDERFFFPLPVIRPEQAVLSGDHGLVQALDQACRTLEVPRSRRQIRAAIDKGAPALRLLLDELARAAAVPDLQDQGRHQPHLVLSIDQAEELFMAEGREEAQRFLALLRELLEDDQPALTALFTIRSDSYSHLQSAAALEGLPQHTFSLPPMPAGAYKIIIEEPAKIYSEKVRPLKIDSRLTEQLLNDAGQSGARDALPLLAFTLGRLFEDYGGAGELRLEEYRDMGGIEGAIEVAVNHALRDARANPALPDSEDECLKLLRRGLIPWMAGIDPETNLPRRRVARLDEVPEEARAVMEHFVKHRLLATDTNEQGEVIIEPAHEALLRQWSTLRGWLAEDAAALSALETLKAATRDWEANQREQNWLVHQSGRLEDAEGLQERQDLAAFLSQSEKAYLLACRKLENETRDRELRRVQELAEARKRTVQRTMIGLAVSVVLMLLAVAGGFAAWHQRNVAEKHRQEAEASRDEAKAQQHRAETARNAANRVISVMLYDLRDALKERGMHSLHERINSLAREYFETFPEDEISDSVLRERASSLVTSTDSLLALGRLQEARQAAEEAVALSQELLSRQPDSADAMLFLAISHLRLGDVAQALEGPAAARGHYEASMDLFRELYDREPSASNARSLAISHNKLALLLIAESPTEDDLAQSRRHAREGLQLLLDLQEAGQLDVQARGWISAFEALAGDYAAAYQSAARSLQEALDSGLSRRELVDLYARLCWSAMLLGKHGEALEGAMQATALLEDEKAHDARLKLAHAHLFNDRFEEAHAIHALYMGRFKGDGQPWNREVRMDFMLLREAGQDHPDMLKIEAMLDEQEKAP